MITIDPNLRGCGVAVWVGGTLTRARYVKNPVGGRGYASYASLASAVWWETGYDNAWIEMPRAYGSVHQKGDPNDLLDVMGVGAALAGASRNTVEHVFPSDWKGQVPKDVMLKRIWDSLRDDERAVVQKTNKADTEDILDAVGIGLWKLGRLNKRSYAND